MAYLVFKSDEIKTETTFIKAAKTDGDLELIHQGHPDQVSVVNITDEEYDAFLNGSKELIVNNENCSFVDHGEEDQSESQEKMQIQIDQYKEVLLKYISNKSNHSQISKLTGALDFVTNLDASSFTYPTDNLYAKCRAAGKYVNFKCL
jgi:hypothetical protein